MPNSDFEQYTTCPNYFSQLLYATNWFNPTLGTPDYNNACSNTGTSDADVPYNWAGFQYAHSGVGYAGIFVYPTIGFSPNNYREYREVGLTAPLTAGSCYYFEMYCNAANKARYKTYHIGVYFSDTLVDSVPRLTNLTFTPQIQNLSTNPFDTLNWTLVSGYHTAQGGEQYIIIGNFENDSLTQIVLNNPPAFDSRSYTYVDDVSLTVCTGMEEFNKLDIRVAPNPFMDKLSVTANNSEPYELSLTDIAGRQVLK